jgi:hypothetical protein
MGNSNHFNKTSFDNARLELCRRRFLVGGLAGAGAVALAGLLEQDGVVAAGLAELASRHDPTLPRVSHFAPKAKRIIYIYLEGGPSQMDLFDPKPELNRLHGQPLPASMLENVRFAFIKKESARLMGTPLKFVRYGECGPEPPIGYTLGGKGLFGPFARNCLLARRLVERGVRVVGVFHASWDHHEELDSQLRHCCKMADQPIAALLTDLKQRGLLDETLDVWNSELGRTPLGENRTGENAVVTGRDHHPFAFSMWMAGGGVKGGQVIGETDDIAWGVVRDPVHVHDLQATILHLAGLDHTRLTYRFQGRDFRLTDIAGNVVRAVMG